MRVCLCLVLVACGTAASPPSPSATTTPPPAAPKTTEITPEEPELECTPNDSECDGALVKTCSAAGKWSAAVACAAGERCRIDSCQPPSQKQEAQADTIESFVDRLAAVTAWHEQVAAAPVKAKARQLVLEGDGSDADYFAAAWSVLNAYPQGHSGLYFATASACGKQVPWQSTSRFGVCGRPTKDGVLVTFALAGNKLGLAAGDTVVQAGADQGEDIAKKSYERGACGAVYPAASGRRDAGAASFFGTVAVGAKLTIKAVNGQTREITVPKTNGTTVSCNDAFGRGRDFYAEATVRADGVAVIRLPSFVPFDKQFPTDPSQFDAFTAAFQAEIVKVFETVKHAKAIVWDLRGNGGGLTKVGLAIINGFATAQATNISYCRNRIEGGGFDPTEYAQYDITPGGPFTYAGKVAIVTDGLDYSAADYFPYAAKKGANALIVGSATAGAFGGGATELGIAGTPALSASVDVVACYDAVTKAPLEGAPLQPSVVVDYEANDVAAGKDTLVEAAVSALGF